MACRLFLRAASLALLVILLRPAGGSPLDSGYIRILSKAEGAPAYVDGRQVGVVPLAERIPVESGTRTVRVGDVEKAVNVPPGRVVNVDMDVREAQPTRRPATQYVVTGCLVGTGVTILVLLLFALKGLAG